MEFQAPVDIGNRACQHVGVRQMDAILGFNENTKTSREISFVYGKLRRAELRRSVWRFSTRKTALRPIDTNTLLLAPTLWVAGTTYFADSIVADASGTPWISLIPNNLGNPPATSQGIWAPYFGPLTVSLYDSTTAYLLGELVYTAAGDGTYKVFASLTSVNSDNPATTTQWSATTTYFKNQVVSFNSTAYMSLVDLNINKEPDVSPSQWTTTFVGGSGSLNWLEIGGSDFPNGVALTTLNTAYPITTGPSSQSASRNAYHLPANFLREASQDPKAGSTSYLGAPTGRSYEDWVYEGNYIVSAFNDVILLRFVADVTDVTLMDDLFCECLAAKIGAEVCETLTQSSAKVQVCTAAAKAAEDRAIVVNAIEIGAVEPAVDDYIACRG